MSAAQAAEPRTVGNIEQLDTTLEDLTLPDARMEDIGEGYEW